MDSPNAAPIITTKHESVEVLSSDGHPLSGADSLNSILDKVESGSRVEDAVKEVMTNTPERVEVKPKEPEVKKVEAPAPVKREEPTKSLEGELNKTQKKLDDVVEPEKKEEIRSEDVPEEELQVLAHDKPRTARRIQALLERKGRLEAEVTTTKKERDERDTKLKELEGKLAQVKPADPKQEEEVQKNLNELANLRRRYQLDNDPQVKAKFDGRVSNADSAIEKTLTSRGAVEPLLKIIREEGGWAKFADSSRMITLNDGTTVPASELAQSIISKLPYSEQRAIDAAVSDQIQAKRDKEAYFSEETQKANEYFKQQDAAQRQAFEASQKNLEESRSAITEYRKKAALEYDFLKEKDIPASSTAEERAAIEDDNEWAKQINGELNKYTNSKNIQEVLAAVDAAVKYHHERHVNAKLTAENKTLKAKLEAVKTAGGTTTKAGSIAAGSTASDAASTKTKVRSLDETLSAMERGEQVEAA